MTPEKIPAWFGLAGIVAAIRKNGNGEWWKWALGAVSSVMLLYIAANQHSVSRAIECLTGKIDAIIAERTKIVERLARLEERDVHQAETERREREAIRQAIDDLKKSIHKRQ